MAEFSAASSATTLTSLTAEPADIEFELAREAIYHRSRESWFSNLHRGVMFVNIIFGAAAISPWVSAAFSGIVVTAVSAWDLAFDLEGKAKFHSERRRKYTDCAKRLSANFDSVTARQIREEMLLLSAEEPAPHRALVMLSYNQGLSALGRDVTYKRKIRFHHNIFRHIFRFEAADFPKI